MTNINDGGPAFPNPYVPEYGEKSSGLSVRDWFAGQALAGWLESFPGDTSHPGETSKYAANIANGSYALADAMLKAREASNG